jgi:GT2 family glycosyltransferase
MKTPKISVIIPTLNREEPLCNTLRYFLEKERYPSFEIIVIDQSDRHLEATRDFLMRNANRFCYVSADYKGLPKARNHGTRLATGEIVVFVDDDVEPGLGFLFGHASPYEDQNVVGVTGPVLQPGQLWASRAEIGEETYQALVHQREMRFDVDFSFSAQWAAGCNMSFRRAVVIDLGGFDELFQRAPLGDDAEFSHRARKKGTICYVPDASLVHLQVSSGGCRDTASRRQYFSQFAFCKNYFLFRIGVPSWRRRALMCVAFRRNVLNRKVLAAGGFVQSSLGFTEGVLRSSAYIRRIERATAIKCP